MATLPPCPFCGRSHWPSACTRPEPATVTGKVLGFRAWRFDGYKLRSAAAMAHWTVGENRARCLVGRHPAPDPLCGCGLYAWHEPRQARGTTYVHGAVLGWGRMEVHRDGWRAEFAEPVMIAYCPSQSYELIRKLQAVVPELGLLLVNINELEDRAAEFGRPVPEELRPEGAPTPPAPLSARHLSGVGQISVSPGSYGIFPASAGRAMKHRESAADAYVTAALVLAVSTVGTVVVAMFFGGAFGALLGGLIAAGLCFAAGAYHSLRARRLDR